MFDVRRSLVSFSIKLAAFQASGGAISSKNSIAIELKLT
jgi:hypothetical protein